MQCEDFLEGYSEYLDGRLEAAARVGFDAHLEACESCARYHRVVQRGLFIYRNLPPVESSPDFQQRLRHRLYHVEQGYRLGAPVPVGSAALLAVAAVGFLALAWLPFATRLTVEVELPAVAVEAPRAEAVPSLFSSGPFLAPAPAAAPAGGYPNRQTGWPGAARASLLLTDFDALAPGSPNLLQLPFSLHPVATSQSASHSVRH